MVKVCLVKRLISRLTTLLYFSAYFLCMQQTRNQNQVDSILDFTKWCLLVCVVLTVIGGEVANFAAYAFAPAILVTPLGALSIIIRYKSSIIYDSTLVLKSKYLKNNLYLAVQCLHILFYGKGYIFLVFLVVSSVLWGQQRLFCMHLKSVRLNLLQKYGILLLNQVFGSFYVI